VIAKAKCEGNEVLLSVLPDFSLLFFGCEVKLLETKQNYELNFQRASGKREKLFLHQYMHRKAHVNCNRFFLIVTISEKTSKDMFSA
jgi:hypothetical protein